MGERKFGGSRFMLLGAVYWLAVMAAVSAAFHLWPQLQHSQTFFYAAVAAALVGGIVVVMLFKPKS
jgi:hypothetical protein